MLKRERLTGKGEERGSAFDVCIQKRKIDREREAGRGEERERLITVLKRERDW